MTYQKNLPMTFRNFQNIVIQIYVILTSFRCEHRCADYFCLWHWLTLQCERRTASTRIYEGNDERHCYSWSHQENAPELSTQLNPPWGYGNWWLLWEELQLEAKYFIHYHCLIHHEDLCTKTIGSEKVMKVKLSSTLLGQEYWIIINSKSFWTKSVKRITVMWFIIVTCVGWE